MKRVITILLVVVILLSLPACTLNSGNSASVKNEDEMIADLQRKDYFYGATIESLEVIKRQTVPEQRLDTVFIKTVSHDDSVRLIKSLQLTYGLYNEGWILDEIAVFHDGENRSEPLAGPDDSVVDKIVGTINVVTYPQYTDWWSEGCDVDLSEGYAEMRICAKVETVLWDIFDRFTVPLWFNSATGNWEAGPDIEMRDYTTEVDYSRLCDDYYYNEEQWNGSTVTIQLNILDVDYENATITIDGWRSYQVWDYSADWWDDRYENLSGTYSFEKGEHWKSIFHFNINAAMVMKIYSDAIWLGDYCLFREDR